MSHIPVNHPLRPLYRVLAALSGVYVLIFGVLGFVRTSGEPVFGRGAMSALGLRTNQAFSIVSVVAGISILLAYAAGRNIDSIVYLWGGMAFLVAGMAMMAVLRTNLNFLNFSMATCVVSFLIGTLLFSASLYVRSSSVGASPAKG